MTGKSKRTVLVTGAGGFVGRHVCASLEGQGHIVRRITRTPTQDTYCNISDLASEDIPDEVFQDVDLLIHLAAGIPAGQGDPAGVKTAEIAERVACQARRNRTPRAIHMSSIAARLFQENDPAARSYGAQKLEAEELLSNGLGSGCRLVTLRPPVIYGPDAKGSFAQLIRLIERQWPLPLSGADQGRCYLSIGNLSALVLKLVEAGDARWKAADRCCYEPHDGTAVPTNDLVLMLANSMGAKARMFWAPPFVLKMAAAALGKQDLVGSLFATLQCRETPSLQDAFGWHPHEGMPESLAYLEEC